MKQIRVFSFGGGVQSTAVLVLQALGRLATPYDVFVFANVGEDSENPATIEYMNAHLRPYAVRAGITLIDVQKTYKKQPDTLVTELFRDNRSISIPARMGGNGAPGNRQCTTDFKIRQIDKWIREQKQYDEAVVGLGISLDEFSRMRDTNWHEREGLSEKGRKLGFKKKREYPLIDLRLSRQDCLNVVWEVGLPPPPKSSCFFCPFHSPNTWIEMKRKRPDLFEKSCQIEEQINKKRGTTGRDSVYLHKSLVPLRQAVGDQMSMFSDESDSCESGYCMT